MIETMDQVKAHLDNVGTISGVVGRMEDQEGNRYYQKPGTDELFESVTQILGAATAKPWLGPWNAKMAASVAIEKLFDVIAITHEQGPEAAREFMLSDVTLKEILTETTRLRELKADLGTYQHDVWESLLLDMPIPDIPKHLVDVEVDGERVDVDVISHGLLNFTKDFGLSNDDFLMSEATVANTMYGYAGTLDSAIRMPRLTSGEQLSRFVDNCNVGRKEDGLIGLFDLKAGKNLGHEMKAQISAYRNTDEIWIDDNGVTAPMIKVDFAAILHLRKEHERGYKVYQVSADQADFDWFLHCQEVLRSQKRGMNIRAGVIYPPMEDGSQPLPPVSDIYTDGFGRARAAIVKAGIKTLGDMVSLTETELGGFKGVGPAYVRACVDMLEQFGMALRTDNETEVAY